jgi:hypothetical protein
MDFLRRRPALYPRHLRDLGAAYDQFVGPLRLSSHRARLVALQMIIEAQNGETHADVICEKALLYLRCLDDATSALQNRSKTD